MQNLFRESKTNCSFDEALFKILLSIMLQNKLITSYLKFTFNGDKKKKQGENRSSGT